MVRFPHSLRRAATAVAASLVATTLLAPGVGAATNTTKTTKSTKTTKTTKPGATATKPAKVIPAAIMTKLESEITKAAAAVAGPIGLKTGKATCPRNVPLKAKTFTFQCTVAYEGKPAPYLITFDPVAEHAAFEPAQAIIATALLIGFVRENVTFENEDNVSVSKIVDCGKSKVLIVPAGAKITCQVSVGTKKARAILRVKTTDGDVILEDVENL